MKLDIPKFESNKELFSFLVENEISLTAQKCSAIKLADGIGTYNPTLKHVDKINTNKANQQEEDFISVKAVINTTNILDSHGDVHIKGLWNKSLKENKRILMLQEHKSNEFSKIIASGDDLKASVKNYTWKELGFDAEGETQALVFDAKIKKTRNSYMFEQYKNGYVDNHSVGMQYVKLKLAINDEAPEYAAHKEVWDANIDNIVNKADAEARKYFWAVYEAKAIEGSAVPNGSNPVTPTLAVKSENEELELKKLEAIKAFLLK